MPSSDGASGRGTGGPRVAGGGLGRGLGATSATPRASQSQVPEHQPQGSEAKKAAAKVEFD
jgi:hypothetical protein